MKNRLFALVLMPVLSLLATATLADLSAEPDDSGNGISPVLGQIKNQKQCEGATFFKNVFPSLTNGGLGGSDSIDVTVDGKTLSVDVVWYPDNSFDFTVSGGYAKRLGVTVDTNNFIYDYTDPADGIADTQLNYYANLSADDVNHLDLCLETLDSDAPEVGIRVEPSSDGTNISGEVSIIATVTDESAVNLLEITIVGVADGTDYTPDYSDPTVPVRSDCDPDVAGCSEYTWSWDTSSVPPGEYTITIGATDASALANLGTDSITVTVSVLNCLEGDDGITGGAGGVQGCNPSGFQWVELPEELRDSGLLDGETLTQVAVPALPGAQTLECGGPIIDTLTLEREFPFVGRDPRWVNGVYDPRPLDLSEVFDLSVFIPGNVAGLVELRADTRGEECLALLYGEATFGFEDFYDPATNVSLFGANRYTYAITQLPETPALGLPIPADIGPRGMDQIDLLKVPEATYQPTDRFTAPCIGNQLGPFTNETFNPQRAKVPEFSFYGLGTVQICESLLGSGLGPNDGRPYYDEVLECSTDLAVEYFDDLDVLLSYVGEPSLPDYPEACLIDPSAENLRVELNKARSMIKVGDWTKATTRLNDLLLDVEQGIWRVDARNCPGHVVMRIENLLWRTAQLELAESLLP